MELDGKKFAANMRLRAWEAGLSFTELCDEARLYPMTYNRWERGESSPTFRLASRVRAVVEAAEQRQREQTE